MTPAAAQVRKECQESLEGRASLLDPLRGTSVLITGGTGFVGAWVGELLACLNDDWGLRCRVTLLARSVPPASRGLAHLTSRKDFRFLRQDVVFLRELPRDTNWLLHAAGTPDSRAHSTNPIEALSTFVEGTLNVVRGLDPLSDFRRMLHLSSASVYGAANPGAGAIAEDCSGTFPPPSASTTYVEAKRCGEAVCAAARTQKRLPLAVARPFAFVGPYQELDSPWAVNNFLDDALQGRPIRVQGDGETVRSYLYGSDMAFWLLRMLTAEAGSHPVWNLGSAEAVSLKRLAELVATAVSPAPRVLLRTATGFNPPTTRLIPDLSRVKQALALESRVCLADAVTRTIAWHRLSSAASTA